MISHVASVTKHLRIGAGGVLLPFQAPLKVAEQFNLLEALFPGRIDLGLGRSGGSEGHAPQALGFRGPSFEAVDELLAWLGPGTSARPVDRHLRLPAIDRAAEPWVLGTSPSSATYAGQRGLPYAFGGFLDPRGLVPALNRLPPGLSAEPLAGRAQGEPRLVRPGGRDRGRGPRAHPQLGALVRRDPAAREEPPVRPRRPVETCGYSPMEQMAIQLRRQFALVGTADQVLSGLEQLVRDLAVDELTLVTIPFEPEARLASYRLLAEAR